jgi:phosphohistidine phosphatase SixA
LGNYAPVGWNFALFEEQQTVKDESGSERMGNIIIPCGSKILCSLLRRASKTAELLIKMWYKLTSRQVGQNSWQEVKYEKPR